MIHGFWRSLLTGQWGASRRPERFFEQYGWTDRVPVHDDKILIASGYGAQFKRWFDIPADLAAATTEAMQIPTTAEEERDLIQNVLGNFEMQYSRKLHIRDRPGTDFEGSGDRRQLDCVDEAWNATVVLIWMNDKNLLKFHEVREPLAKMTLFVSWNHYAAIIEDKETHILWAVDGSVLRGGGDPDIVPAHDWHE